jgi:YGGT family
LTIQDQRSVTTEAPTTTESGALSNRTLTSRRLDVRPSNNETARRIVVLVFGLIQIVIGLRIVLLVLNARSGNFLVSIINNLGGVLIAPFEGILRTNAFSAGGSVLDIAAIVALVGWTIVELIVMWSLAVFRHEPAATV